MIGGQPVAQLCFGLATNDETKGFGIAAFTRSRTFARSDFRGAKDRLVLVRTSRRKTFFNNRTGAVDRKNGFPIPSRAGYLDTFNESIGAFLIGCGFLTR